MDNQAIRTALNQILARNADRPEHTVDDIMELFGHKDNSTKTYNCEICNNTIDPKEECWYCLREFSLIHSG